MRRTLAFGPLVLELGLGLFEWQKICRGIPSVGHNPTCVALQPKAHLFSDIRPFVVYIPGHTWKVSVLHLVWQGCFL